MKLCTLIDLSFWWWWLGAAAEAGPACITLCLGSLLHLVVRHQYLRCDMLHIVITVTYTLCKRPIMSSWSITLNLVTNVGLITWCIPRHFGKISIDLFALLPYLGVTDKKWVDHILHAERERCAAGLLFYWGDIIGEEKEIHWCLLFEPSILMLITDGLNFMLDSDGLLIQYLMLCYQSVGLCLLDIWSAQCKAVVSRMLCVARWIDMGTDGLNVRSNAH